MFDSYSAYTELNIDQDGGKDIVKLLYIDFMDIKYGIL